MDYRTLEGSAKAQAENPISGSSSIPGSTKRDIVITLLDLFKVHESPKSSLSSVNKAQFEIPVKHLKRHSLHELIDVSAPREDNLESVAGLVLVEDSW